MEDSTVHIIVAGAGPGGLMAAVQLKNLGFRVTVIERTSYDIICSDKGGAYDISSNCRKIFEAAGLLESFDSLGGQMNQLILVNAKNGSIFKDSNVDGDIFFAGIRRSDLQRCLLSALDRNCFVCGSAVSKVEQSEFDVTVTLQNGETITGDILIGADGIQSAVLRNIYPEEVQTEFTNCVSFWGFFEYTQGMCDDFIKPGRGFAAMKPGIQVGGGLVGKDAVWAGFYWSDTKEETKNLTQEEVKKEALARFGDFIPASIPKCIERSEPDRIFKVNVYDRNPLKSWSKGRVVLIGDAAHAMNPFAGQGANMAIIDGFLIASMLRKELGDQVQVGDDQTKREIPTESLAPIFSAFEAMRKEGATKNLEEARRAMGFVLGGTVKNWIFRTAVRFTPASYFQKLLLLPDTANNSALEYCGINPTVPSKQ